MHNKNTIGILVLIGAVLIAGTIYIPEKDIQGDVLGAPVSRIERNILPETPGS